MDLINDLRKAKIITNNEASMLSDFLKKELSNPLSLLKLLYYFFVNRDSEDPLDNHNVIVIVGDDLTPLPVVQQNKLKPIVLLKILKKHDLISDAVNQKLALLIKNYVLGEMTILHFAVELADLHKSFNTKSQLEFAESLSYKTQSLLYYSGMLNADEKSALIKDITENKLKSFFDFFKYSYCCAILRLPTGPDCTKKLLTDLTSILNKKIYSSFDIQEIGFVTGDFSGPPPVVNKQTIIYINTGDQTHEYNYPNWGTPQNEQGQHKSLLENVLTSVNSLLADFNCTYRFTSITSKLSGALFPEYTGEHIICRVEQENKHLFGFDSMKKKFLYCSPQLHFQYPISYKRIAYSIHHFKESGILSKLSLEELNSRIANIYQKSYYLPSDILTCFPEIAITVVTEPSPGKMPYKEFLESLNRISGGILNFSNIEDGFPNYALETYFSEHDFKISFEIDKEQYTFTCNYLEVGFTNPVIYGIQEVIKQNYPDYKLIRLSSSRMYHDLYLFAPKAAISYLESVKVF